MLKKDYILRLIQDFVQVLAKALRLKQEKKYEEAIEHINEHTDILKKKMGYQKSLKNVTELKQHLLQGAFNSEFLPPLASLCFELHDISLLQEQFNEADNYAKSCYLIMITIQNNPSNTFSLELEQKFRLITQYLKSIGEDLTLL